MRPDLAPIPRTYAELLRSVQRVLFTGRQDIEAAWVRTYHDVGRLIHEHILSKKDRANYGAGIFEQLATDTEVSKRVLYECRQFYRCFPIVRPAAQLTWTHYQLLCQVDDAKRRASLTAEVAKSGMQTIELKARVRSVNAAIESATPMDSDGDPASSAANSTVRKPLVPRRGVVGRYRLVDQGGTLCVDLGFKLYLPLSATQARPHSVGEFVDVEVDASIASVADGRAADLFTYDATVRRVIDGDTLEVAVGLPRVTLREKLRLRGLDCPEIDTAEGKAAKRAVEALVREAKSVVINTTKPDKYDRYLADVFLESADGTEVFLDNHLLTRGFAERKDAWEFSDWEKTASR